MSNSSVKRIFFALCAAVMLMTGCSGEIVPVAADDPQGTVTVNTARELISFLESSEGASCILGGPIDLGDSMLKINPMREISIDGNSHKLTGSAECLIRLDDGAALVLSSVTLEGKQNGIGMLGNCSLFMQDVSVTAELNAISGSGKCTFLENSAAELTGITGHGITVKYLELEANSAITASGGENGIQTENDILLKQGASMTATGSGYNALKCGSVLSMMDGSKLTVTNLGSYHGAELGGIAVSGTVTINAKGGEVGAGLFVISSEQNITVNGSCSPEARYESGDGKIEFIGG